MRSNVAVLAKDEESADPVWLPKSQIELDHDDPGPCSITIPNWLAEEKGLA